MVCRSASSSWASVSTSTSILTIWPTAARARSMAAADAARRRDVVVLDEHRVEQAEPMVGAAARTHRVFLEGAQAGRGLPGADDFRARARHRLDETVRRGRNPAQMLDQVQRHALRRKDRPRLAAEPRNRGAGAGHRAFPHLRLERHLRIERPERRNRQRQPRDAAVLAQRKRRLGNRIRRDQRIGGDVAREAQILRQRRPHGVRNEMMRELQSCFEGGHYVSGLSEQTQVTPLTLSLSPWEKGPLNSAQRIPQRPLSHGRGTG